MQTFVFKKNLKIASLVCSAAFTCFIWRSGGNGVFLRSAKTSREVRNRTRYDKLPKLCNFEFDESK